MGDAVSDSRGFERLIFVRASVSLTCEIRTAPNVREK